MRISRRLPLLACMVLAILAFASSSAGAASPVPGWRIDSVASPTDFSTANPSSAETAANAYLVYVTNAGSEATDGTPVTITDTLPKGVTAQKIELFSYPPDGYSETNLASEAGCAATGAVVRCELPAGEDSTVPPDGALHLIIDVSVDQPETPGPVTNAVTVSGGGALGASLSSENQISSSPPAFGPSSFDFYIDGADGARDTQAGGHPYELTTTIDLNSILESEKVALLNNTSVHDVKDVVVDLPLGFAGSTLAAPQCPLSELESGCPSDTVVGHIRTEPTSAESVDSPLWNLAPEHGYPAEFGYADGSKGTHVFYVHVVPTPAGYVIQTISPEIPQVALSHIVVTFYGEPAKRDGSSGANIPFFTNPTACSNGNLKATIWVDSWQHSGSYNADGAPDLEGDPNWVKATSESPPVTGCDELSFAPELRAQPTTSQADTPSGLEFELKLPQTEDPGVHATPALKNATVTMPEGMTIDPSSGNGLQACSVAQIGWLGGSPFNFNQDPPQCPEASKIGTLELESPLTPGILIGTIYLAAQNENPFNSTLAAYVVVDDPVKGVVLKIAGEIKPDPHTGRLTTYFPENAQLPFSDLRLHFFAGPRASLATPESCGTFTTTSDLAPWSAPDSGPDAMPFDSFVINEGCVGAFAPSFTGGTTNLQAGAYTPFVASFSRADTDQELAGLTLTMPPGLEADIANVPECPEAQANAGTCPESTQIGTVQSEAGPGPNPLANYGKVYFTGPYNGGAFGLSVVVPAVAGPFNFGNVVVRQSLRIDPYTAQVTDVSNPFPTILQVTGANGQVSGIPIKLRRVDVRIERPGAQGFTFNPTSCGKLQVAGAITSTQGASSSLTTPFQVTNCATLKFAPKFSVSTSGKTSKAKGADLITKLSYPSAPQGTYADIARVKVDLPKQLPSRLTTLQKACTDAQFNANPAGCPSPSLIGQATVHTPLLPVPLTGPAIFVSHGGEAFPSLTMVLQGDGVTVDLVGTTNISKAGITSTTFKTLPDTPFSTFELVLPEGKYSALAANGNLCKSTLKMPNEFVAQNGMKINQSTPITVTGCKKTKAAKHHRKKHKKKKGKRK